MSASLGSKTVTFPPGGKAPSGLLPHYGLGTARVTVERRPSLEALLSAHQERMVCFEGQYITDAAVVEAQRLRMESVWRALPEPGRVLEFPEVRLGASDRAFSPYTQVEEHHPPLDPVNLVFWGNASVDRVASAFRSFTPGWIDSDLVKGTTMRCALGAMPQTVWFRPHGNGARPRFVWCSHSLSPQGFELERIHVRLFDGGFDPSPGGWGRWSLGSVHLEEVELGEIDHTVREWDAAQDEARRCFAEALGERCDVAPLRLQPEAEELRGVRHDGVASAIRLP
ncbi:MAG TPA: hypothetical protein VGB42_07540 [Candidatus Thermoplasmatota archaeon]